MVKKNSNTLGTLGAFIAGAAAAAVAGGYFLYGPDGKENRKKVEGWALKMKGEVLEKIEKTKDLTEQKYHIIVDAAVAKYGKTKEVSETKVKQLGKELKKHWAEIEKEAQKKGTQARKRTKVARKKVARKINPDK
jgi:gas vesicle protein